jgi:hypothetical protein
VAKVLIIPYLPSGRIKNFMESIISGDYSHPIFLSWSISKSIAKRTNNEPIMKIRSERAARITNISVSLISLR